MSPSPWQGSVQASGFIFEEALMGRAELLRRLLASWSDGARLARSGTRWYLLGLSPRLVDSRVCIGAPLVRVEGRWLMGPAAKEVLSAAPLDSILECVGGERRSTSFAALTPVHPSELIEVQVPPVLEVALLAPPPQPVIARRPDAPTLDAVFAPMLALLEARAPRREEATLALPPPRPNLRARLGAWLTARARRRAARPPPARSSGPSWLSRWFARSAPGTTSGSWLSQLGSWFAGSVRPSALPPRGALDVQRLRQPPPAPPGPSWLERLGQWLAPDRPPTPPRDPPRVEPPQPPGWFTRTFRALFSSSPTPDKQREYLDDLRRRFDLGDLSEALRRAIPLGGSALNPATGLVSLPTRRDTLSLFSPPATGPSMVMPDDEYAAMKKLYRESADALVARGQIEEAAYVLAKLLNDARAGVALLETHGKLELAAQLATAQHLPEVDRIRLWLLAGRRDEAIRIARGSTDFGTLVGALSTRDAELARQLCAVWGDFLADRQRYTEAIVVTASLTELPATWDAWLSRSLEAGGAPAATALAVNVARRPEQEPEARTMLTALLADDQRARLATTAAEAFLKYAPKARGPLYRDLWRRLMRGASSGHQIDQKLVGRVLEATADQSLVVDSVTSAPRAERAVRECVDVPPPAVPTLPVLDVAPLPRDRRVLAHGAAGLRIVSARGETMRHLLVKADLLVAGPVGVPVLVLSLDGELTRCWKLDPNTLELTSWFQARLSAASRRYDGLCWAVGLESALVFLDPNAASPMEWWRVPNVECRAIDANGSRVVALGTELGLRESWRYVFNAGTERLQIRYGPDVDCWVRGDTALPWELKLREDGLMGLKVGAGPIVALPSTSPWSTFPMEAGLVLTRLVEGAAEVRLAAWEGGGVQLLARLARTQSVRCRDLAADRLALCDEHGRATELDLS